MDTRIREFRKKAGLTLGQLAERVDMSIPYLSQIERGANDKRPSTVVLSKIATALRVSPRDLLSENRTIPVLSYVGAGAEIYPIDDHMKGAGFVEPVPAPPGAKSSAVALVVRGDSMYPKFEDGDIIIYDETQPVDELLNKTCVVGLRDGRVLVKKIRRGGEDGYRLSSHNADDIEGACIDWAAKVAFVIPA